jgi:hypothetical protein
MHGWWKAAVLFGLLIAYASAFAQQPTINQYTVKRTPGKITVDGKLNEPGWQSAAFTVPYVVYNTGAVPKFPSQAKMLWDDTCLYIGIVMTDKDVWANTKVWTRASGGLFKEEVAEVFIDPDGDGLNYIEAEFNPYGAMMPLLMTKEYAQKGTSDYNWTFKNQLIGTSVQGTLNDSTDVDTSWTIELALPFADMASVAPTMSFPPKPGDSWRINLYRYEYTRPLSSKIQELTAWNQTDSRGFHAPDKFGKITFSSDVSK